MENCDSIVFMGYLLVSEVVDLHPVPTERVTDVPPLGLALWTERFRSVSGQRHRRPDPRGFGRCSLSSPTLATLAALAATTPAGASSITAHRVAHTVQMIGHKQEDLRIGLAPGSRHRAPVLALLAGEVCPGLLVACFSDGVGWDKHRQPSPEGVGGNKNWCPQVSVRQVHTGEAGCVGGCLSLPLHRWDVLYTTRGR